MDIHEYQAKQLLGKYGIPTPAGSVAYTPEEAQTVAASLGGTSWMVKAQVLAGERAGAGGVRRVTTEADVRETAAALLGERLVTTQTGAEGELVNRVYIETACDIEQEYYAALALDRETSAITLVASAAGGSKIESTAAVSPEQIQRIALDPARGIDAELAEQVAKGLGCGSQHRAALAGILTGMFEAYVDLDASLIELNPLAITRDGDVLAVDAKVSFDDNALFRHPDLADLRDAEDPGRLERARHGFNYIELDGNIGCMVNGAALAMTTLDMLKLNDGEPANFLDIPPVASRDQIAAAFKRVLSNPKVTGVLVNIIGGGITKCDVVAEGMAAAAKAMARSVPLVVRFEGINRDLGKKTLRDTGVTFTPADGLADAAEKIVALAGPPR